MAAKTNKLDQAIADLTQQVAQTQGVEGSAIALINGYTAAIQEAVAKALADNEAADQTSIDTAADAIDAVRAQFTDSGAKLGQAVAQGNQGA